MRIGYLGALKLGLAPATINALARLDHSAQRERACVLVGTALLYLGICASTILLMDQPKPSAGCNGTHIM